MQPEAFSQLFPLFNAANPETLEQLLSAATQYDCPPGRTVLMEDSWGNAVYFLASGWVKVRRQVGDDYVTLAVLSRGDFFGEMAILDESPRSTDVTALSTVELVSIPAQLFIQTLFKDSQLHHRMLQLMVKRLRLTNIRFQLSHKASAIKLANTLLAMAEAYGTQVGNQVEIFNIPPSDLAAVADVSKHDVVKLMAKLEQKAWIRTDPDTNALFLTNLSPLKQLLKQS
ncbi:Crp/Fnr family transcriptional regulator [Romeria aff. gracilis LEGE 07310]|uniref:Crp/Fnr family transcriptional regulator n=1 Tax=Vasconcelosia minhoensis LEGE 07310 TaxID=915328 RepID=A0A8J7DBS8_9CYAN|nr:Crp/Fnr family transcriptional regulator [Romeria aff. gracilis LEGE 07310]